MPKYYLNYLNKVAKNPKQGWTTDFQQRVSHQFYNTNTWDTIEEELTFGTLEFTDVDARINHIIASYTSANKSSDFRKLIFEDITKTLDHGYRFRFDGDIWLATDYDSRKYESNSIIVRKCNHTLKWYNDEGKLIEEPCIVDYFQYKSNENIDENKFMTVPDSTRYLLMQNNEFSTDLYYDRRFIFNRMAWRLINWDEISEDGIIQITVEQIGVDYNKDDMTNEVPVNVYPVPTYTIEILNGNIEVTNTGTFQLQVEVTVDEVVDTTVEVSYSSSDESVATVDSSGLVSGVSDGSATITAYLTNNSDVDDTSTCTVTAAPATNTVEDIIGDDDLTVGSSSTYTIYKYVNGVQQVDTYAFSLNNTLATITSSTNNTATIEGGEDIGSIILSATNNVTSDVINKTITLTQAW